MTAKFERFDIQSENENIAVYERICDSGATAKCYFCRNCGTRLIHDRGTGSMSVKAGCLVGLTREMYDDATHIWTKRAIVPIPVGRKSYEEEPDE